MDFFRILGVKANASKQEISVAFRMKAKKLHPDVTGGDPILEKQFKELNDAYRAALEYLETERSSGSMSGAYPSRPQRLNSIKEIHLGLAEAINGTKYRIDDSNGLCDTCGGEGHVRLKQAISCSFCGGTGNSAYRDKGPLQISVVCSNCVGSGKTIKRQCFECHGFGTKAGAGLVVDLPPGCLAGDSFIVENGFSNREKNIIGDLELVVNLKPDPLYKVHGRDIHMQLFVEVWDAVLGAEKGVVDPGGVNHRVRIKSGTSHGTRLRVRNMGMRRNTDDQEKGDLIISVAVLIPTSDDPKIKEAYERLRRHFV